MIQVWHPRDEKGVRKKQTTKGGHSNSSTPWFFSTSRRQRRSLCRFSSQETLYHTRTRVYISIFLSAFPYLVVFAVEVPVHELSTCRRSSGVIEAVIASLIRTIVPKIVIYRIHLRYTFLWRWYNTTCSRMNEECSRTP